MHEKKQKYIASSHLGIAASALNGQSLYSLMGVRVAKVKTQNIPSLPLDAATKKRLSKTKLVILDEMSLVG